MDTVYLLKEKYLFLNNRMEDDLSKDFGELKSRIINCQTCKDFLPNPPKPIFSVSPKSKILIIGQAPGNKVHLSSVPWDDQSGIKLRNWLGVTENEFYNTDLFGIMPMGFCYPGKGKTGDLPPRPECAPQWHDLLLEIMPPKPLKILIGTYAQNYYLRELQQKNLTETVRHFKQYLPDYFPLVHPSPLNFRWQSKNKWFETDLLPVLQEKVRKIIKT